MPLPEIPGAKFRVISEEKVPVKLRSKSQLWLKLLQNLPEKQAIEGLEDELGIKGSSMKIMVARFKKSGLLTGNYYVTQRTDADGKRIVYVVHSSKQSQVEWEHYSHA